MELEVVGEGVDIHELIGKLPRPKSGWTQKGIFGDKMFGRETMRYHGPYNDLDKQLVFDKNNGKIIKFIEKPAGYIEYPKIGNYIDTSKPNSLDFWAAVHDVQYSMAGFAREKALKEGLSTKEADAIALKIKNRADKEMANNIKMSKLVNIRNPMAMATHYGMRFKNFVGFGLEK